MILSDGETRDDAIAQNNEIVRTIEKKKGICDAKEVCQENEAGELTKHENSNEANSSVYHGPGT